MKVKDTRRTHAILLQLYAWLVGGIENRVRKREGEREGKRRKRRKGWGVENNRSRRRG